LLDSCMQVDDGDIFEVYITLCVENARYNSQQVMIKGWKASRYLLKPQNFLVDTIVMVGQIRPFFHTLCILFFKINIQATFKKGPIRLGNSRNPRCHLYIPLWYIYIYIYSHLTLNAGKCFYLFN
jgi:hypothetical protein